MPASNIFRHQRYGPPADVTGRIRILGPDDATAHTTDAVEYSKIWLIHGTFVGNDPFGVVANSERVIKRLSVIPRLNRFSEIPDELRKLNKKVADQTYKDHGNFTEQYAQQLQQLSGSDVQLFNWTGENNHLARVDNAVRLLCELDQMELSSSERIMLWAHSHGGNSLAVLSNLLSNQQPHVNDFLEIGKQHFPESGDWIQAQAILKEQPGTHRLAKRIDMVTFGTPIRYGWDSNGAGRLLHFVNHVPQDGLEPYVSQPPFPQSAFDIWQATFGDWVQAFGIVGTDIRPSQSSKRKANRQFRTLLEQGLDPSPNDSSGLWERIRWLFSKRRRRLKLLFQPGIRVAADGHVILKDYGESARFAFGHAVYTQTDWLDFHWNEVQSFLASSEES